MKALKILSALALSTILTFLHGHAMENIKQLDHTWKQDDRIKYNLTYNNVIGLDAESPSPSHNSFYTPHVCVIDNMKEHGKHICSTIAEICPTASIREFNFTNAVEVIRRAASCSFVDIMNLSFGPAYLSEIFGYEKLFVTYSQIISSFTKNFILDNAHKNLSINDRIKLTTFLDGAGQKIDIMMRNITDAPFLVNNCVSLEQLSKDTYELLNNDLQIDEKYTRGLNGFIRTIDAFVQIPHMLPSCPLYQAILEAAKKGKIIIQAFGNEHNYISSNFENEYANRLNALAKLINENPDITGRYIIAGNSQYIDHTETLHYSSTRSNLKQSYVLTAPGTDITARISNTSYESKTGTSMAAPAVNAVIGRLLSEYKTMYENSGIEHVKSIRGIIADHVIKETRKTNFFTQELLPDEFGQGVVNYGFAKQAIERDLLLINYESKLKEIYETKMFLTMLQNELEHRIEIKKMAEQVYKLEKDTVKIDHKYQILTEMLKLEEIRSELTSIYNESNKVQYENDLRSSEDKLSEPI